MLLCYMRFVLDGLGCCFSGTASPGYAFAHGQEQQGRGDAWDGQHPAEEQEIVGFAGHPTSLDHQDVAHETRQVS